MSGIHFFTGQVICSPTCPIEHIDIPGDRIKAPEEGWPDISGLNNLQASNTQWLSDSAIEAAVREYHSGLAPDVQSWIDVTLPLINSEVFFPGQQGEDALVKFIYRRRDRMYRAMKQKEYSIFPVNTQGNHWVTVVLHKELSADTDAKGKGKGKNKKTYSRIGQMAVIDPFRDDGRIALVTSRMESILRGAAGFQFSENFSRTIWCPHQPDGTSCGPRSYWCAKQLMDRIQGFYESGYFYNERFWGDLSGWFNEDFVRGEMIGRTAWAGVKAMGYNARLAIECVNRVKNYGDRSPDPTWLSAATTMKPSNNHLAYEKRRADKPPPEEPTPRRRRLADPGPPPRLVPGVDLPRETGEDALPLVGRIPSAMEVDNSAQELASDQPHRHAVAKTPKREDDDVADMLEDVRLPADSPRRRAPTWSPVPRSSDPYSNPFMPPREPEEYASVVDQLYDPNGNPFVEQPEASEEDPFIGPFSWGETF